MLGFCPIKYCFFIPNIIRRPEWLPTHQTDSQLSICIYRDHSIYGVIKIDLKYDDFYDTVMRALEVGYLNFTYSWAT